MQESMPTPHQWNILCVDDEQSILNSLKRVLRKGPYKIFTALSGPEGLKIIEAEAIDLVISDMRMGEMSGAQMLAEIAASHPSTIRILLTGYSDLESTIAAVNQGKIHHYLEKPWDNDMLLNTLTQGLAHLKLEQENAALLIKVKQQNDALNNINSELEERVKLRTQQIQLALDKIEKASALALKNHKATLRVFYNLISTHQYLGGKKAQQISQLCLLLAKKLDLPPADSAQVKLAGLLHELGLLCVDTEILSVPFSELSPEQQSTYKTHPQLAFTAMSPVTHLSTTAKIILNQYKETTDPAASIGSKILAVARDYINGIHGALQLTRLSSQGSIDLLIKGSGSQYDENIVALLPEVIPAIDEETLSQNEQLKSAQNLTPGLTLSRDVYSQNDILLLSEGHVLTTESIDRLSSFTQTDQKPLDIYVVNLDESTIM